MFSHFRILLISIITLSLSFSTTLLNVDFETEDSGYTASDTEGTGFTELFNRSNPDVGGNSSFLWAFENFSAVSDPTISLSQINASGYDAFSFSIDLLAHHYNDWDPGSDHLKIYYSLDGGEWQNLMWVLALSNGGDSYNEPAALDTDFDGEAECAYKLPSLTLGANNSGNGDCIIDNNLFETFTTSDISLSNASTLDIKLEFTGFVSGDEGGYLDNIAISGTTSGGVTCDDATACNDGAAEACTYANTNEDCAGDCTDATACNTTGSCTYADTNEDCAGNCLDGFTPDCAGVCGGTAVADCAGACGGTAVVGGCDNVCGSTAVNDLCNVCGGDNLSCIQPPENLFFSEYAEGSSNNKYLEIYNATDAAVDLSWYSLSSCSNGCDYECFDAEASNEQACLDAGGTWNNPNWDYPDNLTLGFSDGSTSLGAGELFVVCHGSSDPTILAECDQTFTYLSNGDDVLALTQVGSGDVLDVIGLVGDDPGSGWEVAGIPNATKDHTLVRKSSVSTGNSLWLDNTVTGEQGSAGSDAADSEWIVDAQDTWDNLGSHTYGDPCADVTCDDSNVCTTDSCVDGSCVFTNADGLACDDGDGSTANDVCNAGSCAGTPVVIEGCLDSNATNYDSAADTQSYTYDDAGNPTSSCTYASCADIPDNDNDASTAPLGCLWDTGQSAMWWDGWWNCTGNGGEVCGLAEVVFELDLPSDVTGTPHVQGTYNGWCGSCYNTMDDTDGDGVWTHTQYFSAGEYHEYKFSANVWESQEDLVGLTDCAVNTDTATNYWNRYFTTGDANTTLTLSSCWGTCDDTCSAPDPCADVSCDTGYSCDSTGTCVADPTPSDVTFTIDGLDDCVYASITGSFGTAWNGWGTALCDEGAGTACEASNSATVSLDDGSYDFQIVCVPNGTADGWWDVISGGGWATYALTVDSGDCWNGDSTYANYTFTVDGADLTVAHCAGSCDATCSAPDPCADVSCDTGYSCDSTGACVADPTPSDVTFTIDGLDDCVYASITGSFGTTAWNGWGTALCDEGAGTACEASNSATVSLDDGSYDFQIVCVPNGTADGWWDVISGGGWATYALTVDSGDCWNGDSTYANYTFTVAGADLTVAHCAGSCDTTCAPSTTTSTYDWSDGGTVLGTYGNIGSATNENGVLVVTENPLSGTPSVYIAAVSGLTGGETIDVCVDMLPETSDVKGRIWGHYYDGSDYTSYDGSASGPSAYADDYGNWSTECHTWTVADNKVGFILEARLYSYGDGAPLSVDNLSITTTGGTVHFPVGSGGPGCASNADCDDNNSCTVDTCEQDNTCSYDNADDGLTCDDGDYWTGNDSCLAGVCTGGNLDGYDVTFSVDMGVEGVGTTSVDGVDVPNDILVRVATVGGSYDPTGWVVMTDDGTGVYSATMVLPAGTYGYNFNDSVGNGYESGDGLATCGGGTYGNDRVLTVVDTNLTLDTVCWESCDECPEAIFGCTNSDAYNYDSTATDDDGSCITAAPDNFVLYINEFHYDNENNWNDAGDDDVDEGIEVVVTSGLSDAELGIITVTKYNGNGGSEYGDYSLTEFTEGVTVGGLTYYYMTFPPNGMQNGSPDGLAVSGFGVLQFLSYEGTMVAADGAAVGVESTDVGVSESGSTAVGTSIQFYGDDGWFSDIPASLGTVNPVLGCLDPAATNYDSAAVAQTYNQYGTSTCTYASCDDTPTYVDASSNTCLWADGTSSNWWEGPWNCGDGTACGYAKVNFSVSATSSASVAADFNGWSDASNPLGDADADGVFDGPVWLLPGDYEYKFVVDGGWESLAQGLDCTATSADGVYTNRTLSLADTDASSDVNLSTVCAGSCYACGFDSCANNSCESWESCVDPVQAGAVCECTDNGGNVNGSGDINVTDIVALVGYILGCSGDATCFTAEQICNGDLNGDGAVNVNDVISLVNIILADRISYDDATSANIVLTNNTISVNSNGFVAGVQMTLSHGSDFSLDLKDSYVSEYSTIGNKTTLLLVATDNSLEEIATYKGSFEVESVILCNSNDEISDVNVINVNSIEVKLAGPNPFNPSTSLNIVVAQGGFVSVNVYNLIGQKVATLLNGYMDANLNGYPVNFNGSNLASGVYLVRAETAGNVSTQKLMLLK